MALNTEHKVTLTEGEISVVLFNLEEKYGNLLDGEIPEEVQTIFSKLEGTIDDYYDKVEKAKSKQPVAEWQDTYISVTANVDLPIISIIISTYTTEEVF